MPYVDPAKLVADARSGGYAVGAFNMHNVETTQALVLAAEEAKAPVFLQVGRAIVPHMGLRAAYEMTKRVAEESGADVVIHLDHGPEDEVLEAIKLGFGSVMYDGAHLPFEENIRSTRRLVERHRCISSFGSASPIARDSHRWLSSSSGIRWVRRSRYSWTRCSSSRSSR